MLNHDQSIPKMAKAVIVYAIIFLFPLFFLPITQEFYATGKLFLLGIGALALLGVSLAEFISTKKFIWEKRSQDTNALLIFAAMVLSVVITTPNKVMALFNNLNGVIPLAGLILVFFALARVRTEQHQKKGIFEGVNTLSVLSISAAVLAIISIVSFFQPFRLFSLPRALQFLNSPSFSPIGSQIDLAILLGFAALALIATILRGVKPEAHEHEKAGLNKPMVATAITVTLILVGLVFSLFQIFKPGGSDVILPPYNLTWYAAVESLKNPMTALFGVGIGNFSSIFTQVKDAAYAQSPLWQIQSFAAGRSGILHILSTMGLFGLVAYVLFFLGIIKNLMGSSADRLLRVLFGYMLLVMIFLPPSLTVFFLLFIVAGMTSYAKHEQDKHEHHEARAWEVNVSNLVPAYAAIILLSVIGLAAGTYVLGRAFASEYAFRQSLEGLVQNDAQKLYNNQRQAVLLNPYNDRFRASFSQTNLLIANNYAAQASERELSDVERQTIVQAIQAAIQEAKAAVILNPNNSGAWENLANIYRNIINLAQGADGWTVAAYQRAISLDPQNPNLWLNLGGVFYSQGNYEQAGRVFEQAVTLRPTWPNALYNLAWATEMRGDHVSAAILMQRVLTLIDPVKEEADYQRAQADFESFRAKIQVEPIPEDAVGEPQQLSLPTPPVATLEPKLELPFNPDSPEPPPIPRESNEPDQVDEILSPESGATESAQ